MFKKYISEHEGVGTLVNVAIDNQNSIIKRTFRQNKKYNDIDAKKFFENEVKWLETLESRWIPETVYIDYNEQSITQKYYAPCLLDFHLDKKYLEFIPDIVEQVVEMYEFFKLKKMFKRNGSLSNMTHNNGQLVAFDFKWATVRPKGISMELYSYNTWLSKIDPSLPKRLKEII